MFSHRIVSSVPSADAAAKTSTDCSGYPDRAALPPAQLTLSAFGCQVLKVIELAQPGGESHVMFGRV